MSICSLAFFNVSVLQVHRMAASHHTILPWKTLASSWRHAKVGTSVGHRWILLLATDGYFCWPQMDTLTWPRTNSLTRRPKHQNPPKQDQTRPKRPAHRPLKAPNGATELTKKILRPQAAEVGLSVGCGILRMRKLLRAPCSSLLFRPKRSRLKHM